MKSKEFHDVDYSKYMQLVFNKNPLIVGLFMSIIILILGILVSNILLIILSIGILLTKFLILIFYVSNYKNASFIFEKNNIEYENCYSEATDGYTHSIEKYVSKYKIFNIKEVKSRWIYFTIYGDIEYNLYKINSLKEENIDNSVIIKSYKFDKITILNLFKNKTKIMKNIKKYIK